MAILSKEQILGSRGHRKTAIVDTPEWGGSVIIIELSGTERDAYEADLIRISGSGKNAKQQLNMTNVRAKLVARCIVKDDDFDLETSDNGIVVSATLKLGRSPQRMFSDVEISVLGETSGAALDRVFERCQILSGIREEDIEELVGTLKNEVSADIGTG